MNEVESNDDDMWDRRRKIHEISTVKTMIMTIQRWKKIFSCDTSKQLQKYFSSPFGLTAADSKFDSQSDIQFPTYEMKFTIHTRANYARWASRVLHYPLNSDNTNLSRQLHQRCYNLKTFHILRFKIYFHVCHEWMSKTSRVTWEQFRRRELSTFCSSCRILQHQ